MPSTHARNIALTPELSAFVDELVASGDYANASEVMRAGLRALKDRHGPAEISERIIAALDQLERGEGVTGDPRTVLGGVDGGAARCNRQGEGSHPRLRGNG